MADDVVAKRKKRKVLLISLAIAVAAGIATQKYLSKPTNQGRHRSMDPVTFIFPNLYYSSEWDVADGRILWPLFVLNNIAEPLIRYDNQTNLQPGLIEAWSYSENRKLLTLKTSDKYLFHDGKKITTEDVARSLLRTVQSRKSVHSDIYDVLCENGDCNRISLEGERLSLRLDKPVNGLLTNLATPEFGVVPGSYEVSADKSHLHNLSGPYKVMSFNPDTIALESFDSHPLITARSPKTVFIKQIPNTYHAVNYYNENPSTVLIASDYAKGRTLKNIPGNHYVSSRALTEFILPNINSSKLDTVEKRKRIFAKLHQAKKLLEIEEDLAEKTNQLFTRSSSARFNDQLLDGVYQPDHAEDDQTTTLRLLMYDWMKDSPIPFQLKEIMQSMGINLEVTISPPNGETYPLNSTNFDLLYISCGVSAPESIIELIYLFKHPISDFGYKNKSGLELLNMAKHASSESESIELVKQVHRELISEYRILPIMHTSMMYISNGDVRLESSNVFDGSFNIWDWRVKK